MCWFNGTSRPVATMGPQWERESYSQCLPPACLSVITAKLISYPCSCMTTGSLITRFGSRPRLGLSDLASVRFGLE